MALRSSSVASLVLILSIASRSPASRAVAQLCLEVAPLGAEHAPALPELGVLRGELLPLVSQRLEGRLCLLGRDRNLGRPCSSRKRSLSCAPRLPQRMPPGSAGGPKPQPRRRWGNLGPGRFEHFSASAWPRSASSAASWAARRHRAAAGDVVNARVVGQHRGHVGVVVLAVRDDNRGRLPGLRLRRAVRLVLSVLAGAPARRSRSCVR